jgi:hypothetical protein
VDGQRERREGRKIREKGQIRKRPKRIQDGDELAIIESVPGVGRLE